MEEHCIDYEAADTRPLKRRKVRKGTVSCWECKRRKTRCTFALSTQSACDGCKSRRTKCLSQEFYNETQGANKKVNRSAGHPASHTADDRCELMSDVAHDTSAETIRQCIIDNDALSLPSLPDTSMLSAQAILTDSSTLIKGKHDELGANLLAVWPNRHDLNLIMGVKVGVSVLFHGTICVSYSNLLSKGIPSQQELLEAPSSDAHPVLIARKLLMLSSFLQGLPSDAVSDLIQRGVKCCRIMNHAVETASKLVTGNDELVDSLDGIECIMIESMYHNNAGNLRRAWLINRRAMLMAQMMGLHLSKTPSPKVLHSSTRERIDPKYMWLRMTMSDRYLSLILGLPHGILDSSFAAPHVLKDCSPMERMERIEMFVAGLIIERNGDGASDLETTRVIDKRLQDAAASMPAEWWLAPNAAVINGSDTDAFNETIRLTNQLAHYQVLTQLHLPYLLQSSVDRRYDYSKITAAYASREILSRFVSFLDSSTTLAYCRGIDFLAFIASAVLCLSHIDAHRNSHNSISSFATALGSLAHQRLGDRGLMEHTLDIMHKKVQLENDSIACKISDTLQRLLTVEAAAFDGCQYNASVVSQSEERNLSSCNHESEESNKLCIDIPHFGTIKIEQGGVIDYVERTNEVYADKLQRHSASKAPQPNTNINFETNPPSDQNRQQSRRAALSSRINLSQSPAIDTSEIRPCPNDMGLANESRITTSGIDVADTYDSSLDTEQELVPELSTDTDDWILQGVDMALFDNLFDGLGESVMNRE